MELKDKIFINGEEEALRSNSAMAGREEPKVDVLPKEKS